MRTLTDYFAGRPIHVTYILTATKIATKAKAFVASLMPQQPAFALAA